MSIDNLRTFGYDTVQSNGKEVNCPIWTVTVTKRMQIFLSVV